MVGIVNFTQSFARPCIATVVNFQASGGFPPGAAWPAGIVRRPATAVAAGFANRAKPL